MILNLNFSKLVNIGVFAFDIDEFTYSHNLFIVEDSMIESKYYLIDVVKNITKNSVLESYYNDVALEEVYIVDFSLKKDILLQIISFLEKYNYISDVEFAKNVLADIDISFFEIRYNFFESSRIKDSAQISAGELYCSFSKIKTRRSDGSFGATIEDINLLPIKKILYSFV